MSFKALKMKMKGLKCLLKKKKENNTPLKKVFKGFLAFYSEL